ncbi:hypothetical protein SDC9_166914 [bioreactor metagenome]|uniref:Uncharacterized protein n=1 Tax=bioreactor metagenome TaxID=1076179 RepID=A0A645G6H8_9ZZZZ
MRVELDVAGAGPDRGGGLVEALQCLGAGPAAGLGRPVVVERHVQVVGGEDAERGTARGPELQLVTVPDPAGEVEQLAQGDPHRRLELPRVGHVAGQRVQRHAPRALRAHRGEGGMSGCKAAVTARWN